MNSPSPPVSNCIIVHKKSLWGYRGDDEVPFIKIVCSEPKALPKVKDEFSRIGNLAFADDRSRLFERGQLEYKGLFPQEVMTYESNIAYPLRFMIDTKVSCCMPTSIDF